METPGEESKDTESLEPRQSVWRTPNTRRMWTESHESSKQRQSPRFRHDTEVIVPRMCKVERIGEMGTECRKHDPVRRLLWEIEKEERHRSIRRRQEMDRIREILWENIKRWKSEESGKSSGNEEIQGNMMYLAQTECVSTAFTESPPIMGSHSPTPARLATLTIWLGNVPVSSTDCPEREES